MALLSPPELGAVTGAQGNVVNGRAALSPSLPLKGGVGEKQPTMRHFPGAKDNLVGGRGNPIRWARLGSLRACGRFLFTFWLPQALKEKV